MDAVLILLVSAAAIVLVALFLVSRRPKEKKDPDPDETTGETMPAPGARRNRSARARLEAAAALRARQRGRNAEQENWDPDDPEQLATMLEEANKVLPEGNIGAKKLKKLQEKEERAAKREEEAQLRQDKKERDEQKMAERRLKEEEREAEEARQAEEEQKRKEEQEKREQEEYERLKSSFTVEESGEDAVDEEESQNLLQEFIDFIKTKKVVQFEDLAAQFNLKTQDAIARLKDLLAEKRIKGLMDDRGKFIYITDEEYLAVAKYIRQHGRVSIADLAQASTKLLNL